MSDHIPHLDVPPGRRDHFRGREYAAVMLVEYGDFQCASCGSTLPVVDLIRHQMGDALGFVFRHFPLTAHPNAQASAEAAEAAGAQGRFWEMHDFLYQHHDTLTLEDLVHHAAELGLDVPRFRRELESGTHASHVREDYVSGVRSGVHGAPTFYINGLRHEGLHDPASLMAAVRQAMGTRV